MIFDYRNEAYLMICSFENYRDFKRVDPFMHGFSEEYIRALELDEEETEQLVRMLWDFHNEVREEETQSFDESDS